MKNRLTTLALVVLVTSCSRWSPFLPDLNKTQAGYISINFKSPASTAVACPVTLIATDTWPLFVGQTNPQYQWGVIKEGKLIWLDSVSKSSSGPETFTFTHDRWGSGKYAIYCKYTYYEANSSIMSTLEHTSGTFMVEFTGKLPRIHDMHLEPSSVKGGANGKEPKLVINLDTPAASCGQKVFLSSKQPKIARIMGSGWFMIEPGKTHGELSWFLGTKDVKKTKRVDIVATVNGVDGYANIEVRE